MSPSTVYTPRRPLMSTTALRGTMSAFCLRSAVSLTRAYIPGFRRNPGFGISNLHGRGARGRVEHRRHAADSAHELLARKRVDFDRRLSRRLTMRLKSFSTRLAMSRTVPMSTSETIAVFRTGKAARVEVAPADHAIHRRDEHRVREVDLELVETGLRGRELGFRDVDLRDRPSCNAPRRPRGPAWRSARARSSSSRARARSAATFVSFSRETTVARLTSMLASDWLTCSRSSRSSTLATGWPCATRSPSLTCTESSRPATRGTTSTVASPIRLPTTVM